MPLAVEQLTPDSPVQAIRDAISKSVQQCMQEGKSQEECAGMAYGIARDKTGQALAEGTQQV